MNHRASCQYSEWPDVERKVTCLRDEEAWRLHVMCPRFIVNTWQSGGTLWPAAFRPWALEWPINTEDLPPRSGAKCGTWAGSGGQAGTRGFIGVQRAVASPALADLSPCNKQNSPLPRKPSDLDKTPEHLLNCRLAPRLKRNEAADGASGFRIRRRGAETEQTEV